MLATPNVLSLILPSLLIGGLAVLVPWRITRSCPESLVGLSASLILSGLVLWGLSAGIFAVLYAAQGVPWGHIALGWGHVLLLGAKSALIWLPILLLYLATQPQKWRPDL